MLIFLIVLVVVGTLLFIYMWREAFQDNVKTTALVFENFPDSFGKINIFFISDIHRRTITTKLIEKINDKVDIVIIGGDLMEKGVPFDRVKENLVKLKGIGPLYFVWGNNDYEVDYHQLDAILLENGVKILDNTAVTFESESGECLSLLGIDDLNKGRSRLDLALLDSGEGEKFKILVSHNPGIMKNITPEQQISLILSGHTHGGQIRFFSLGLYKKGRIEKQGDTILLVSNGYGTSGVPLRLGARPETHLITISSKHNG